MAHKYAHVRVWRLNSRTAVTVDHLAWFVEEIRQEKLQRPHVNAQTLFTKLCANQNILLEGVRRYIWDLISKDFVESDSTEPNVIDLRDRVDREHPLRQAETGEDICPID